MEESILQVVSENEKRQIMPRSERASTSARSPHDFADPSPQGIDGHCEPSTPHGAIPKLPRLRSSRSHSTWWLAIFAFCAIIGIIIADYGGAQDNDMWWLFATGREIVENGIPQMNPFSVWGDQTIVIQQWIPAVIDYLVYSAFGFAGIGVMVALLCLALAATAYALARTFSHGRGSEVSFVAIALLLGCCSSYLTIRPQVWSMIAYLCTIIVLERYRRSNDPRQLLWLGLIMVIHINVHMSMALFDLVIMAAYLLPDLSREGGIKNKMCGYDRRWLLFAIVVCACLTCANPYGIDGALYLIHSYDAAAYGDYIVEMKPITIPGKAYGWCMVAFVALGGVAIGKSGIRRCDLPLIVLYIGTAVMSFQYVRNVWLVSIFAFALVALAFAKTSFDTKVVILRDDPIKVTIASMACAIICISGIVTMQSNLMAEAHDSTTTPVDAVAYLDDHTDPGDTVNVFTHFNAGGYLEWRGYHVSMDARPELWNDAISRSGEDRYYEYIDMTNGKISSGEYMTGKAFDYMIVNTDTDLYEFIVKSMDYDQAMEGNGYVLFRRHEYSSASSASSAAPASSLSFSAGII